MNHYANRHARLALRGRAESRHEIIEMNRPQRHQWRYVNINPRARRHRKSAPRGRQHRLAACAEENRMHSFAQVAGVSSLSRRIVDARCCFARLSRERGLY